MKTDLRPGQLGGLLDLRGCRIRLSIGDVLRDAGREDQCILQHQRDVPAEIAQFYFSDIVIAQQIRPPDGS